MTTSGDGQRKRTVHVPMCLLRGANARICETWTEDEKAREQINRERG